MVYSQYTDSISSPVTESHQSHLSDVLRDYGKGEGEANKPNTICQGKALKDLHILLIRAEMLYLTAAEDYST